MADKQTSEWDRHKRHLVQHRGIMFGTRPFKKITSFDKFFFFLI